MAKEKKGKDAKNKEVEKKNLLKHVDSIVVGNGTVEVFGFKPMGSLDTVLLGVAVNKAGDPTSVNFLEAHNVKLKSKKGNPSLVFENAAKAEAKAETALAQAVALVVASAGQLTEAQRILLTEALAQTEAAPF